MRTILYVIVACIFLLSIYTFESLEVSNKLEEIQDKYIYNKGQIVYKKYESKNDYKADIAIIMCSYKRVKNMKNIIGVLQKQNYPIDIYIWNNNYDLKEELNNIISIDSLNYNIYIHHSSENIYPIARFIIARSIKHKYKYFVFLDDDQILDLNTISGLKEDVTKYSNTILGMHGKKLISRTNYWNRRNINKYEEADYVGTAGMIAPSYIFTDKLLTELPKEYRKVEDFWLNVFFVYYYGGKLRKSSISLKLIPEWKQNALSIKESPIVSKLKNKFLVYVIDKYEYDKYLDNKNNVYQIVKSPTPYVVLDQFINKAKLDQLGKYLYTSPAFKEIYTNNTSYLNLHKKQTQIKQINITEPNFKHSFRAHHYNKRYSKFYDKTKYYTDIKFLGEFIESLPFFKDIGFIKLWVDFKGGEGKGHVDHTMKDLTDEFVWICPYGYKKLYVVKNGVKHHIKKNHKCIWFNTKQTHGIDSTGDFSISLRIDGVFTEEFRQIIIKL